MASRAEGDFATIMAGEVARAASASIRLSRSDFSWLSRVPMPRSISRWPRSQAVVDTAAPAAVATTTKLVMVLAQHPFLRSPVHRHRLILMDAARKEENIS